MSAENVAWVEKHSPMTGSAYQVHMGIADIVSEANGNKFFMRQGKFAKKVRLNRTTVNQGLQVLIASGFLRLVKDNSKNGCNDPSVYQLLHPAAWRRVEGWQGKGRDRTPVLSEPLPVKVEFDSATKSGNPGDVKAPEDRPAVPVSYLRRGQTHKAIQPGEEQGSLFADLDPSALHPDLEPEDLARQEQVVGVASADTNDIGVGSRNTGPSEAATAEVGVASDNTNENDTADPVGVGVASDNTNPASEPLVLSEATPYELNDELKASSAKADDAAAAAGRSGFAVVEVLRTQREATAGSDDEDVVTGELLDEGSTPEDRSTALDRLRGRHSALDEHSLVGADTNADSLRRGAANEVLGIYLDWRTASKVGPMLRSHIACLRKVIGQLIGEGWAPKAVSSMVFEWHNRGAERDQGAFHPNYLLTMAAGRRAQGTNAAGFDHHERQLADGDAVDAMFGDFADVDFSVVRSRETGS